MTDGKQAARRSGRRGSSRLVRWVAASAVTAGAVLAIMAVAASGRSVTNGVLAHSSASSLGTVLYGTLPPTGTPKKGGTITQGQLSGQTPTYIFPIAPGANTSTGTISFLSELFMPLYAGPTGARPKVDYSLSAANPPIFSDGDKTVTIPIKPGLKWSNGAPLDANDVVFWFDLLQAAIKESPANWGQFSPGLMPQNVKSISTKGKYDVVMHLTGPYNPGFFLNNNLSDTNNVYPLPSTAWNVDAAGGPHLTNWQNNPAVDKKIYDYLNKAGCVGRDLRHQPAVEGGRRAVQADRVQRVEQLLHARPEPELRWLAEADHVAGSGGDLHRLHLGARCASALAAVDVAVGIDPSQLAEAPALKSQGIDIFGGPGWGWFGGIINFKDKTNDFNNVIAQLYVRQAIDYLIDQPAIIKGVYKGAAVPAYTEVPTSPVLAVRPGVRGHARLPVQPERRRSRS